LKTSAAIVTTLVFLAGTLLLRQARTGSVAVRSGASASSAATQFRDHGTPHPGPLPRQSQELSNTLGEEPDTLSEQPLETNPGAEITEPESATNRLESAEPIAVTLAVTNLKAAIEWLSNLPEGHRKEAATREVAYEAANENPQTALELAAGLPANPERDQLLDHAVSQFATSDARDATDWVLQIPDSSLRNRLLAAVATAAAEAHPAEAAALVATGIEDGEEQTRAVVAVVQRWVQTAPQAAAAWVEQFPQGPLRHAAAQNLLVIWSLNDHQAANTWLRTLPEAERADLSGHS
jgi:hypothetical protein